MNIDVSTCCLTDFSCAERSRRLEGEVEFTKEVADKLEGCVSVCLACVCVRVVLMCVVGRVPLRIFQRDFLPLYSTVLL